MPPFKRQKTRAERAAANADYIDSRTREGQDLIDGLLDTIAQGGDPKLVLEARKTLLAYHAGKPSQAVEVAATVTPMRPAFDVDKLSLEELEALDAIYRKMGVLGLPAGDGDPDPDPEDK